jgi:ABC-type multidrug transport system permease subunit
MNAITEVCKERNLVKREYMTTLSLGAYILSKSVVMALLCAIQSLLFAGMFYLNVGLPEEELLFEPFWEITLTVFMTLLSGASIGMLVSCLSKNEDQAAKFAPILLIPQLLFSGVIFDLGTPFLKNISYVVTARYAMEVFGSFANLNLLDVVTTDGIHIPREDEEIFTFTAEHINDTLIKMILFVLAYCILSAILLRRIKKADD